MEMSVSSTANVASRGEMTTTRLPPQTGTAFVLAAGDTLRVIDPEGEQVADLVAFSREHRPAWLSAGRTFDYNNTLYLTTGHGCPWRRPHRVVVARARQEPALATAK